MIVLQWTVHKQAKKLLLQLLLCQSVFIKSAYSCLFAAIVNISESLVPFSSVSQYMIVMKVIEVLAVVPNFSSECVQLQVCSHGCRQCHSSVQN